MLKVGYAERILPVPSGQPLMGHTRDSYAAVGTHDPLFCKVVLWENLRHITGIIVVDLCMVDASFVKEAKAKIGTRTDLTGDEVFLSATHTHSGPAVFSLYKAPVMDVGVRRALIDTIVETLIDAKDGLQQGAMRFGSAQCNEEIGFYRRLQRKDGSTMMNWEVKDPSSVARPLGFFDAEVRILELIGNSLHVCLVNYPLHPAILDYTNHLYSRDYPGYMEKALQQIVGNDLKVVFANACCGNINHIDYADPNMPRCGYAAAQRVGYVLATAAMEALRTACPVDAHDTGRIEQSVGLQRIKVPELLLSEARRSVNSPTLDIPSATDGLPFALQAPLIIKMAEYQDSLLKTKLSVTRIGSIFLFGFPGEMTFELQTLLGQALGDIPWMAIELADDAIGYIAHRDAYAQGGYETQVGATLVSEGSGEQLVKKAIDMYRQLNG